ncbi:ABC transporter ATP-binding protein [Paramesorhizobium deserti]|uniref:ABC transporter ATP-binding protein n=1 Tax=Paramesorhizobium deserti TaxID=1494590 RepID=A0A135HR61_9HYPH|nr:ABC transporter ATP-binding protein [Paramesorhizobium deserti]KXF75672.1 ABC transporter ATP-binding protein [Paramesorhizobium deserti]
MTAPLLSIRDLVVNFHGQGAPRTLIDHVSVDLAEGEILGLVGESGSGKSLLCRAVMGLLPSRRLMIDGGLVALWGRDLVKASPADMLAVRGREIGMIFQNPTSHLDPVMKIGDQIAEGIRFHQGASAREAREAAVEILRQVGFPDPARQYDNYPHEFSGGMRQRAMIAAALSCRPKILIADEPTTALDVTIQAQILELLLDLRERLGLSVILITHDLGIVAQTCDRIAVMRDGKLVEQGPKRQVLRAPKHDYTRMLIGSHPSLPAGNIAKPCNVGPAVRQKERPLLEIDDLHVRFDTGGSLFRPGRKTVSAVKGVSLQVMPGDAIGIVGESGSGKSTLARAILGLVPLSSGHIAFDGVDIAQQPRKALAKLRRETAMVFQDPLNALNPRLTVGETLGEVLKIHGTPVAEIPGRINELLDLVHLGREFAGRKPRSMSGGQCQRVGIARALAVNPRLIIADECVAALDVTIQKQIVDLFAELKARMNLTLLFIAHDLAIVRNLCERVLVMYHGEIVEEGLSADIFARPQRPYTAALIDAVPDIDPDKKLLAPKTDVEPAAA